MIGVLLLLFAILGFAYDFHKSKQFKEKFQQQEQIIEQQQGRIDLLQEQIEEWEIIEAELKEELETLASEKSKIDNRYYGLRKKYNKLLTPDEEDKFFKDRGL